MLNELTGSSDLQRSELLLRFVDSCVPEGKRLRRTSSMRFRFTPEELQWCKDISEDRAFRIASAQAATEALQVRPEHLPTGLRFTDEEVSTILGSLREAELRSFCRLTEGEQHSYVFGSSTSSHPACDRRSPPLLYQAFCAQLPYTKRLASGNVCF